MNIEIRKTISFDEVNYLRKSVGFRQLHEEQIQNSLSGSAIVISTYIDNEIVGMARLIWDSGSVALISDLLILPEFSSEKIEEKMINEIFDFLKSKLNPGYGIQVDIKAWGEQFEIFESIGFQESTVKKRGVPMHKCLTKEIELTDKKFRQSGYEAK